MRGAGSGRRKWSVQKPPLEEYCRDDLLEWMRSILLIAVIAPLTITAVRAKDTPPSNSPLLSKKGPNYPNQQRGPAYPATRSDEQSVPPFIVVPVPQTRDIPARARPVGRPYPSWPLGPFHLLHGWRVLELINYPKDVDPKIS